MAVYDHRDTPAYRHSCTEPHYCENPHILKWWSPLHDELLSSQIEKEQWVWYWSITDEIIAITPPETIAVWKTEDPLCLRCAWYNTLMHFAASRAEKLGLTEVIREPERKACPLCNQSFIEDSLPVPLVKRLGIQQLDFCAPCLSSTVFQNAGNETLSKQETLAYVRDLADVLQRVPSQDFGNGMYDLYDLSTPERLAVLRVLKRRPTHRRVKKLFGSWLKALIEAGVLEDSTRRTTRGTQCLARDGHVCLSLGEKTIDDFLHASGISHEKEPRYPEVDFRADFAANGVFVEYFGLTGNRDYDAKTRLKQELCKKHGIKLISVYPSDLVSSRKLEAMLLTELSL